MRNEVKAFATGRQDATRLAALSKIFSQADRLHEKGHLSDEGLNALEEALSARAPIENQTAQIEETGSRSELLAFAFGYYSMPLKLAATMFKIYRTYRSLYH
jgi:hypothetical protein